MIHHQKDIILGVIIKTSPLRNDSSNVILSSVVPLEMRAVSQFIQLLPHTLVDDRMVYEYRLVKLFGNYLTAWDFAPFMYILLAIIFVAAGRLIYGKQK